MVRVRDEATGTGTGMPVLAGTSGWQYRDWREVLYPAGVPQRSWLECYAEQFSTVENNGTFYRLPARAAFESWRDRTPGGFVMAVKASRYLTHVRLLRDPAQAVRRLMDSAAGLGDRLGPVLIQLPPTMTADVERLDACLRQFPSGTRVAVEPRHPSWWTPALRDALTARGAALCWADRGETPVTPLWRTAEWGYVRFHQGTSQPWPSYTTAALRSWVSEIGSAWGPDDIVYAYFNNDQGGAAVRDARVFAALTAAG